MVIAPEQAELVRKINEHWDTTTIQKMPKNEKYKGDTMLQKT